MQLIERFIVAKRNVTIDVDIDGVLRDFTSAVFKFVEEDLEIKIPEGPVYANSLAEHLSIDRERFLKWMYESRVFEIFGMANKTYPRVIDDLNFFTVAAESVGYDVRISSVQRNRSITATLHWLSKNGCRLKRYNFWDSFEDKIAHCGDIVIDDAPAILRGCLKKKRKVIAFKQTWNEGYIAGINLPFIAAPGLEDCSQGLDSLYEILDIPRIIKVL
jgi:hypothetical protein